MQLRKILAAILVMVITSADAQRSFKVIAFYTAKHDAAHISFVSEANAWFSKMASAQNFSFSSTPDWSKLLNLRPTDYEVVIFLDTRPDSAHHRQAFENYMKSGGAWLGFHFSAFALSSSAYPQNWDWYHQEFLGCGEYASNTWRPTSAILRIENGTHPTTQKLPVTFTSAPNEWYRWKNDLRANPSITILASIDPKSFPLGTGPKPHEIWHEGYYPVVWTNNHYRMVYFNMGHNDMDYGGTDQALSSSFSSDDQNQFVMNALLWLGGGK